MHSIDKINLRIYLLVVWWWRPSGWQQLSLQPRAFRNDVPADVTSAQSLDTFRQRLKTHLFAKSFPVYFLRGHYEPSWTYTIKPSLVDL